MITKAIVRSINKEQTRCIVRMPLFETASSLSPVEAEALVCITPGFFNNLFVGDIVFVGYEENALEKPIILGKLYKGTDFESKTPGGAGIVDAFLVRTKAQTPADTTWFKYKDHEKDKYENFRTPRRIADYILWLESLAKKLIKQLDDNFNCFKSWVHWQLKPENVEIDDGNVDEFISKTNDNTYKTKYVKNVKVDGNKQETSTAFDYQEENEACKVCKKDSCLSCTKNKREYKIVDTTRVYPQLD